LARILGTYRTPKVRIGQIINCEVRGPLKVVKIEDSPVQWPWGRMGKGPASPIVIKDLEQAIWTEAVVDICLACFPFVRPALAQEARGAKVSERPFVARR
jgi:hypothetical protein